MLPACQMQPCEDPEMHVYGRLILGLVFGVLVPLAFWLVVWLDIELIVAYYQCCRAIMLPGWLAHVIPWIGVHVGVVLFKTRALRLLLAPLILIVAALVTFVASYQLTVMWADRSFSDAARLTMGALYLDAIPAATATLLGVFLVGGQNDLPPFYVPS